MTEVWKDIVGYEGKYQVSNIGRVKSIVFKGVSKETIFSLWINRFGYPMVSLRKDGIKKAYSVHRLVYEAFVGPIPDGMQVNHINEVKTDNRVSNLNLMTPKENVNWGTRNERICKLVKKPVTQILKDGTEFFTFFSAIDAERELGVAHQTISKCCKGKEKSAGGFLWKYAR